MEGNALKRDPRCASVLQDSRGLAASMVSAVGIVSRASGGRIKCNNSAIIVKTTVLYSCWLKIKGAFAALLSGYLIILWFSRIFFFFLYWILTKQDENLIWYQMSECLWWIISLNISSEVQYLSIASQLECSCGALTEFLSLAFTFVRGNSESKQVGRGEECRKWTTVFVHGIFF